LPSPVLADRLPFCPFSAYCRKRDREQVLELVMESNTPRILHASIAVFYDTIYKVANASNLAARLGDLQAFLDDLIATAISDHKGEYQLLRTLQKVC